MVTECVPSVLFVMVWELFKSQPVNEPASDIGVTPSYSVCADISTVKVILYVCAVTLTVLVSSVAGLPAASETL